MSIQAALNICLPLFAAIFCSKAAKEFLLQSGLISSVNLLSAFIIASHTAQTKNKAFILQL